MKVLGKLGVHAEGSGEKGAVQNSCAGRDASVRHLAVNQRNRRLLPGSCDILTRLRLTKSFPDF